MYVSDRQTSGQTVWFERWRACVRVLVRVFVVYDISYG